MNFLYNNEGFISLLTPGQNPGIEYHGFFDASHLEAFRTPFCEGPEIDNVTLSIGEPYQATFNAKSPDGKPLTISYSGLPGNATVDPSDGTTDQDGMITANIDFTPTAAEAQSVFVFGVSVTDMNGGDFCSVQVVVGGTPDQPDPDCLGVPGGSAEPDVCGVCEGDGTSCCDTISILGTQFEMDLNALKLRRNIRQTTRKLLRLEKGTSGEAAAKTFRRNTNRQAKQLYQVGWNATWEIDEDNELLSCDPTADCSTISNVGILETYVSAIDDLVALARSARKRVKTAGGSTNKLLRLSREAQIEALAAAGQIPTTSSSCF